MNYEDKLAWQKRLREFQIDHEIPYWKFSYADSLLSKAFDFYDVGQEAIGALTLKRVESWLNKHQKQSQLFDEKPEYKPFQEIWNIAWFESQVKSLRLRLQSNQSIIPRFEFEDIHHNLKLLESKLSDGQLTLEELNELRIWVIERVLQSLGSISEIDALQSIVQNDIQIEGIGPYNNRYNFGEAFKMLSSADPLWVGDFLELYNALFGFEDKVASQVVKRK